MKPPLLPTTSSASKSSEAGTITAASSCCAFRKSGNNGPPLFFVVMRLNKKVAALFVCATVMYVILSLWTRCGNGSNDGSEWAARRRASMLGVLYAAGGRAAAPVDPDNSAGGGVPGVAGGVTDIDCLINGEQTVSCRREGDEVYVPFTFLHRYFEVYGKLIQVDANAERFEWSHAHGRIYQPKGRYDARGVFMHFENYNVEIRDRVKCVSAIEGVPISTQWHILGYPYPTQIAQFGLAHYSKNLTDPEPRVKRIEDAEQDCAHWVVPPSSSIYRVYDDAAGSRVLNFSTADSSTNSIRLKMDHVLDFVMNMNLALTVNSTFTVTLQNREKIDVYYNLHYIASNITITAQENNIYHGIGGADKWCRLTRDLIIDLQKGLSYLDKDKSKHKMPRSKLKVVAITLHGHGALDNLTLATSEHIRQFYDAAEWFVQRQDRVTGGWPNPVRRKLATGFADLEPGWLSAMGQGQAISVLARAYFHSGGRTDYLRAALAGLRPFRVPSIQGGVLATFLNKFHWYEEYPTTPASFVLNGFIYALIGLYDLMTIAPETEAREARVLYDQGMMALKRMLTLFDMGSTTAYDLRHFSLGIAPNLARWDYHATHVNQLLLLSSLDSDDIFKQTADRWMGYMIGKRAAHN